MSRSTVDDALAGYRRVHAALSSATTHRWRDLDITMAQLKAVYILRDEGELTVGRLAERFAMGLPGASLLADRLVQAGLVARREDSADRRRVLLSLTSAGEKQVTDLREGNYELLRSWMSALSTQDAAALSQGLRALADAAFPEGRPAVKATV